MVDERERGEWTQTVRKTKEHSRECRYKGKTPDLLLLELQHGTVLCLMSLTVP